MSCSVTRSPPARLPRQPLQTATACRKEAGWNGVGRDRVVLAALVPQGFGWMAVPSGSHDLGGRGLSGLMVHGEQRSSSMGFLIAFIFASIILLCARSMRA